MVIQLSKRLNVKNVKALGCIIREIIWNIVEPVEVGKLSKRHNAIVVKERGISIKRWKS